jgi:hypothetical protein
MHGLTSQGCSKVNNAERGTDCIAVVLFYSIDERIREDRYPCGMLQACGQIETRSSPARSCLAAAIQPARGKGSPYGIYLEGREEANRSFWLALSTVSLWKLK